jgi:hypothetical protein
MALVIPITKEYGQEEYADMTVRDVVEQSKVILELSRITPKTMVHHLADMATAIQHLTEAGQLLLDHDKEQDDE